MRAMSLVVIAALCGLLAIPAVAAESGEGEVGAYPGLEADLEALRQALAIPGMAAAVVQDQQLVWARGFGYADVEAGIEANPHTPFGLASVTKPIAATLIMQLVEEGAIDLDAPVSAYGVSVPDGPGVTVRHLLNHTSEGVPGVVHNYNGGRYALLSQVIEGATGRTFASLLSDRVLVPLEMTDSALNPLNAWGGMLTNGIEELRYPLGLGDSFRHYPDVYNRLAKPYQLGADFEVIGGMHNLEHSPAAGLNSSVTDLAKFDIALDQGLLLGDQAVAEMFAPAVPTARIRSDVAYGLGWYVQDFDGTQLLWHTGRWPPSNSALYLKVPAGNLTFIVLANTDNLTVPFSGIGDGDISHSALALTFFHHFLYPGRLGHELPSIDWAASQNEIIEGIGAANDDTHLILESELWSWRQAFASSGDRIKADLLWSVAVAAFPDSSLRSDRSYTYTVGATEVLAPFVGVDSFIWISRIIVAWLAFVMVSLAWMIWRLARTRGVAVWEWIVWLSATLLVGPIAVFARWRDSRDPEERSTGVMCASLFCVTGYSVAFILAIVVLLGLGDEPNPLLTLGAVFVLPLVVGLLAIRAPLMARGGLGGYRTSARSGLLGELITWSVGIAVFLPLTLYVDNRLLSRLPNPTSPYFWGMISSFAAIGLVVFLPVNYVLHRRGFTIWPGDDSSSAAASMSLPRLRDSWWMLVATVGIMIVMVGLAGSKFG